VNPALFAHPEWLDGLLWVFASTALALAAARGVARRQRRRLLGSAEAPPIPMVRSDAALLVALAAIALALLGPRIGERVVRVPSTGVDVVFLVDVSRSMDARDVPPSRLDRARRAVEEILGRLAPGDRAALAAFAGRGLLLTPLTPDRSALLDLLGGLDTQFIQPGSSHLADGVRAALEAFETGSRRPRVLFVASDGEDPRRRRDLGGAAAARRQVRVITASLGSERGSQIPDDGRALRDRDGVVVVSRRHSERLAGLATDTDGESFAGDAWGRIDFDRAAAAIRRDSGASGEWVERRADAVRVAPFAALAFALLLIEGLPLPARVRPTSSVRGARGATLACVACLLVAPLLTGADPAPPGAAGPDRAYTLLGALEEQVRTHPEDARRHLDLGLARLERGHSEAAARAFLAAAVFARDAEFAAVAYYDLGVAALTHGNLEAARDAFFDALAADPADGLARFNLEWTLQALASRTPPLAEPETPSPRERAATDESTAPETATREQRPEVRPKPATEPMVLGPEQRRRWLERANDDPAQWLRAAAREPDDERRRPEGPAW
jgi:Ca-activated chloride channel family protein